MEKYRSYIYIYIIYVASYIQISLLYKCITPKQLVCYATRKTRKTPVRNELLILIEYYYSGLIIQLGIK